jgi:hypothetical protein
MAAEPTTEQLKAESRAFYEASTEDKWKMVSPEFADVPNPLRREYDARRMRLEARLRAEGKPPPDDGLTWRQRREKFMEELRQGRIARGGHPDGPPDPEDTLGEALHYWRKMPTELDDVIVGLLEDEKGEGYAWEPGEFEARKKSFVDDVVRRREENLRRLGQGNNR